MIRISMNVVASAIKLMKYINDGVVSTVSEIESLYRIGDIYVDDLIDFLRNCGQITDKDSFFAVTQQGDMIVLDEENNNREKAIRRLLEGYIVNASPLWSRRIPYGRTEAALFMSDDEKSCFFEASLLNKIPGDDEIAWWDNLSQKIRKRTEDNNLETGRMGERLTMAFEKTRTGMDSVWKSIESNLAGYDILSVVSKEDHSPLMIEVKSSTESVDRAYCHLTSHEWDVSMTTSSYAFYFWSVCNNSKKLAILSKDDIKSHIPINNSTGEWESVKIPFASFEDSFVERRF